MLSILTDRPVSRSPSATPEKRLPSASSPSPPVEQPGSVERSSETEEVIKLSHYPSAHVKTDLPAIEREDWPAPPATAVNNKNLGKT